MASDKIARAMSVQNGLEITTKIGELSSEIDSNSSVIIETDKYATSLGNSKDGLLTVNNIKGNTLHNIAGKGFSDKSIFSHPNYTSLDGGYAKINTGAYDTIVKKGTIPWKTSTVYTLILDIRKNTWNEQLQVRADSTPFSETIAVPSGQSGIKKYKFTTRSDLSSTKYDFWLGRSITVTGDLELRFMILEGDWTNKEIPNYFEGIKSVGEDAGRLSIKSVSSNLLSLSTATNLGGGQQSSTQVLDGKLTFEVKNSDIWGYSFSNLNLKPNTKYTASLKSDDYVPPTTTSNWGWRIRHDSQNVYSGTSNKTTLTFTTDETGKITLMFYLRWGQVGDMKATFYDIQLVEGSQDIPYAPYQESNLEIPLSEPLRSLPNGVKDEIVNGKLIRRVGKIVLSGASNEIWNGSGRKFVDYSSFFISETTLINTIINPHLTNDKLPYIREGYGNNLEGEYVSNNNLNGNSKIIVINVAKTKVAEGDVGAFKRWLASNPITLCYELEKPVETILTPPIPSAKAYKNGTLIVNNIITPTLNVSATSNVSSKVYNIETELTRAVTSNNNAWQTLMILADKELRMKSLSLLTTESTTDLKNKVNEMINIWRA